MPEHMIELVATSASAARREALAFAPCTLKGYDEAGECIYITTVRAKGDRHPVATATRGGRAVTFEVYCPTPMQGDAKWAAVQAAWRGVTMTSPTFTLRELKAIVNDLPEWALDRGILIDDGSGECRMAGAGHFETDGHTVSEPLLMLTPETEL